MGPKPAQPSSKEERIIRGLASIVGLSQGDASNFDVLKTVAETLGCTVALDGTTTLEDDEPNSKRAKLASDADEIEEGDGGSELDHSGPESENAQVDSGPIAVEDPRTSDEVEGQEGIADGEALFQWMISPVGIDAFEDGIQEQRPLLVRRPKNQGYYRGLFSKEEINRLLHTQRLRYQYNLDVVSYSRSGTRQNFNFNSAKHDESGEGPEMADPGVVWRRFEREDCSLRVLHPQRYCDALWRLLARLEAHLQCNVGCNSYLTPPGSQGFAPHWDDVDVYILQLEGRKRWRLHAPTDPSHVLPRFSSRDFTQEEVGECVLQEVLAPGDLLYLPRGTVHQAEALPDCHSLHLTISTNQLRTWADFLGEAIPRALQLAAQEHLVLRRSLPRNYLDFMGVMHEDSDSDSEFEDTGDKKEGSRGHLQGLREAFREEALDCMEAVAKCLPLDSTADQLAAQFLKSRLPPLLPASNSGPSTAGPSSGKARPPVITQQSCVRLVMPGIARLVVEDGQDGEPAAMVYHCLANSRHQHASCSTPEVAEGKAGTLQRKQSEVEGQDCPPLPDVHREGKQPADEPCEGDGMEDGVLEFPLECAGTLEALLSSKPGCELDVADLPSVEDCDIDALGVTQVLADVGLITTV